MPLTTASNRTEDLLIGILAVLALRGRDSLRTTDKVLHSAFGRALDVFKQAGGELEELAESYYRDIVSKTYDELNHALIAAESLNLLRFPNPSYTRLQITMTPKDAEAILRRDSENREVYEKAAETLLDQMSA